MLAINSIFKMSRYTSLVIITSKFLITPTPLLDIQPHITTVSFPNSTVGIEFLFSRAVRGCRQTLFNTTLFSSDLRK